ncbi:MAG: site-specific DNA-methyltransferase [Gammaproteobacteria bacterium]|nr:site-specific DNA-methyltransferase [Gammaproteobacteria bacterium]
MENLQLHNEDCINVLKRLPDKSIDLIATDPPYFRVKDNDWDRQWPNEAAFFEWLEIVIIECARVLKDTGSIYLFASPQLAAKTEHLMAKHFAINNHIIWVKTSGMFKRQCKASLRRFFPQTERIIFATHINGDQRRLQDLAHAQACKPIIDYLVDALHSANLTQSAVNKQLGTSMAGHWFGRSQWRLPNQDWYQQLQQFVGPTLDKSLDELKAWENDLLKHRQHPMKRYFNVDGADWYTDVWECGPVQYYDGKHPCEKPMRIMEHIINASSQPNDLILDPFMGGGTTGIAAIQNGRRFIGCELDGEYFANATARLST